jgi:hypothetical protein
MRTLLVVMLYLSTESVAHARCTSTEPIGIFRGIVNNCAYDIIAKFRGSGGYFASHEGLTGQLKPGHQSQTGVETKYKIYWTACEYGEEFSPPKFAQKRMSSQKRLARCRR